MKANADPKDLERFRDDDAEVDPLMSKEATDSDVEVDRSEVRFCL
jgi:hypothetical protein